MSAPFGSLEEVAAFRRVHRRNKYNARKTVVDGIKFDSAKEANRYSQLLLLLRSNKIGYLERQPEFIIHAHGGKQVAKYKADFRYVDNDNGKTVVEDVKSKFTAGLRVYRLKKKLVEAEYGIEIREV